MSNEDMTTASALTFSQVQTQCHILPLVPATILHYTLRATESHIAGMLLGVREGNIVTIKNCHPVLLRSSEAADKDAQQTVPENDLSSRIGGNRHGVLQSDVQTVQQGLAARTNRGLVLDVPAVGFGSVVTPSATRLKVLPHRRVPIRLSRPRSCALQCQQAHPD